MPASHSTTCHVLIRARHALSWMIGCLVACNLLSGCRSTVPIFVWRPPQVCTPVGAKLALAPVAGDPELARRIEEAMLLQRPAACADVALFTADQLIESSPIRLVSTASLNNDLTALQAARATGADILVQGAILATDVTYNDLFEADQAAAQAQKANMNRMFFTRLYQPPAETANHRMLLSWRIIDVPTGKTLGAHSFTMHTRSVAQEYPDLEATLQNPAALLIAGSARETWKTIAPVVERGEVRLAVPWLQPGAWLVRRGVKAAKKGDWPQAEQAWEKASKRFWFSAPAHHNLAIAKAAREDFPAAKLQLLKARGPFNYRLPSETLFWLDQNHRLYHQAHGLPKPAEGWAFPEPSDVTPYERYAEPIDLAELPWWAAIPFVKTPNPQAAD